MNNTYILLRNNSESTPLSLEDLKRIGLLPTDLLWVECQSVCWQHPQEISELKKLLTEIAQPAITPVMDELPEKHTPTVENETAAQTHNDRVYVKLPLNYNSGEDPVPVKQESPAWHSETKTAAINTTYSNSQLSINDTLLNEDGKDSLIRNHTPKHKTKPLESLLQLPLKKIALYAGLVAAGALMMFIIKGTGSNEQRKLQPVSQQTAAVITTPGKDAEEEPAANPSTTTESYDQQNTSIEQTTTVPAQEQPTSPKKEATAKNEITKKETTPLTDETPVNDPVTVAEKKEVKKAPVENIASKLQLKANEYTVAAFGGIRDLKMTLQNDSKYLLDKVSVELHYLNPEGKLVKTEMIDFHFIQPGAEATVAVKKSSRGVKLDYKITRVESKEMALITNSAAGEDNQYSKN